MARAFVFPGQGAQAIGMGKDLAESYPAAKAVFEAVDEALGEKLSALIWDGELGEYAALCAAGALTLEDTARLLRLRGKAMQEAVPLGVGAMAAVLGLGFDEVAEVAAEAAQDQVCTGCGLGPHGRCGTRRGFGI